MSRSRYHTPIWHCSSRHRSSQWLKQTEHGKRRSRVRGLLRQQRYDEAAIDPVFIENLKHEWWAWFRPLWSQYPLTCRSDGGYAEQRKRMRK